LIFSSFSAFSAFSALRFYFELRDELFYIFLENITNEIDFASWKKERKRLENPTFMEP